MKRHFLCTRCGHWHELPDGICPSCGTEGVDLSSSATQHRADHRTPNPFEMPLPTWVNDPSISAPVRFLKNSIVALQWVGMAIAGTIAWMAYWVAV
jgi:uncharacterized OB-fold protein